MKRPSLFGELVRISFLFVLCTLVSPAVEATSYVIGTTTDDAVVNGNCTLREALRAADTNLTVDACAAGGAADTITLPSGVYPFSGGELLTGNGSLSVQSQTLNPFNVSINLGLVGRFLYLQGLGTYVLGGIEIVNGSAPAAEGVGGAIRVLGPSVEIYNFRLVSNVAAGQGGAIYYSSPFPGSSLRMHDGAFLSNSATGSATLATSGGAAYVSVSGGAIGALRDVSFIGNSSSSSISAVEAGALALHASGSGSVAGCVRCTFSGNSVAATDAGGTNTAEGGAASAAASSGGLSSLTDCDFTSNSTNAGSSASKTAALRGTASEGGAVVLERLFFDLNSGPADPQSKDVYVTSMGTSSTLRFYDSQLTFGTAHGLVAITDAELVLGHLTVADYPGYGITAGAALESGQLLIENSIVALNGIDLMGFPFGNPPVQTTNFIGGNPLFVDVPNANYRLSALSPAIGVGTNGAVSVRDADRDHHSRIAGAVTDIGCYEHSALFADDFEVGDSGSWSSATN